MKMIFDFGRFLGWQPKALLFSFVLLLAFTVGCEKSAPPPPAPPSSTNSAEAPATNAAPAPFAAKPVATSNSNGLLTTLQTLNRALMGWMIRNRRHPQNFEDFASTANVQIPNPPPGKKYTLNTRGFIILVDNSTP